VPEVYNGAFDASMSDARRATCAIRDRMGALPRLTPAPTARRAPAARIVRGGVVMTALDLHLVTHTLRDTLPMIPVLFVLYVALEWLSHHEGSRLMVRSGLPGAFGPLAGALLGVIPQCGMSVFMTSLFLGGRVSMGTLVATYLATSDEAIPVLLAHGGRVRAVAAIVGVKIVVGVLAGLAVDLFVPRARPVAARDVAARSRSRIQAHVEGEMHAAPWTRAVSHSLRRTLEIFGWVFVITLAIGVVIEMVGLSSIATGTRQHPVFTLVGASLFGLIPNCSASIAIAEAYLRGVLPFGATIAGLCAGAGYGPILLFRRGVLGTAVRLLGVCLAFSMLAGAIVSLV
jgi:hypothetical protein